MRNYHAIFEENKYYHIYNKANGKDKLFIEEENYKFFLEKLNYYIGNLGDILSYCLLPNHFHFLLKVKDEKVIRKSLSKEKQSNDKDINKIISQKFSNFFNCYTKSFNKIHNRSGSLFTPNYNHINISEEKYLRQCIAYIHLNPVYHNYVENPGNWKFSSFNAFINQKKSSRILREEVLEWFENYDNFIFCHKEHFVNHYENEYNLTF